MEIKKYIFLTTEGYTFQPNSDNSEPDIDNLQVIGFSKGKNQKEVFQILLESNPYLLNTSFDEIFCYEMNSNYNKSKKYFHLSSHKKA